jgi:hypothetical protein
MNKERLLRLAEFLEKEVPKDRFYYNHWVGHDWRGMDDLSCGTTACALGWAATIPEFHEAGLRLLKGHKRVDGTYYGYVGVVNAQGTPISWDSFNAAMNFFEVPYGMAEFLFVPLSDEDDATAEDVAVKIRWCVNHLVGTERED